MGPLTELTQQSVLHTSLRWENLTHRSQAGSNGARSRSESTADPGPTSRDYNSGQATSGNGSTALVAEKAPCHELNTSEGDLGFVCEQRKKGGKPQACDSFDIWDHDTTPTVGSILTIESRLTHPKDSRLTAQSLSGIVEDEQTGKRTHSTGLRIRYQGSREGRSQSVSRDAAERWARSIQASDAWRQAAASVGESNDTDVSHTARASLQDMTTAASSAQTQGWDTGVDMRTSSSGSQTSSAIGTPHRPSTFWTVAEVATGLGLAYYSGKTLLGATRSCIKGLGISAAHILP